MIKERISLSGDLKSKVKQLMLYMLAGMKVEKLIFPLHRNTTPSEAFQ